MTNKIGHINLKTKITGKRSAGNLHAAFDEAGTGNRRSRMRQSLTLPVRGLIVSSMRWLWALLDKSIKSFNLIYVMY
jgi:hypothetical protein